MRYNFKYCLEQILEHEGGFVNHPKDPGGATNKGVTLATYRGYLGRDATVEELKNISREELEAIYKFRYWDPVSGDKLPAGIDLSVFDMAVNAGPAKSIKLLQRALGLPTDGIIGPKTLTAIGSNKGLEVIDRFAVERLKYYRGLSHFSTFGKGWERRVEKTKLLSSKLHVGAEGLLPKREGFIITLLRSLKDRFYES